MNFDPIRHRVISSPAVDSLRTRPGGMANSPEFRAFSRAKSDLVGQLSFTLTFLKDECRGSDPQLLSFDEDQAIFGGHGSTPAQETSKLLDVVLTRIRFNPAAYHAFRNLRALSGGANKPLALLMGELIWVDAVYVDGCMERP